MLDGTKEKEESAGKPSAGEIARTYAANFVVYGLVPLLIGVLFIVASQKQLEAIEVIEDNGNGTCDNLINYNPLPSEIKVLLALVPYVMIIDGVLGMNLSSKFVAPFTLLVTVAIGMIFFQDTPGAWGYKGEDLGSTIEAAGIVMLTISDRIIWTVVEYAFNVFSAFFFLRVLQIWGVVETMRHDFNGLADDPNRKILLIAFGFAVCVAVVAPGGSNFLIAGSILIDMNIMNLPDGPEKDIYDKRIGAICLFGNGLTSAFNLVGVCIIAIADDLADLIAENGVGGVCDDYDYSCIEKQIGYEFSLQFFLLSTVSPLIMALIYSRKVDGQFLKHDLALLILCGLVYAAVQLITALFVGPELPCLTAAGMATIFYIFWIRVFEPYVLGVKPNENEANNNDEVNFSQLSTSQALRKRRYLIPFGVLVLLLLVVRLIPAVEYYLEGGGNGSAQTVLSPVLFNVVSGCASFQRRWPWLAHSGMFVIFSGLITPLVVDFQVTKDPRFTTKVVELNYGEWSGSVSLYDDDSGDRGKSKLKRLANQVRLAVRTIHMLQDREKFSDRYISTIKRAFIDAYRESLPVMVAIASYASIAKVMSGFQMTQVIAQAIVTVFAAAPDVYTLFIPFIGMVSQIFSFYVQNSLANNIE